LTEDFGSAPAWIVASSRRTRSSSLSERAIRSRSFCGNRRAISSSGGSAGESFTLVFSWLAWMSDISPSFTAR
jgi:hypothetical protein